MKLHHWAHHVREGEVGHCDIESSVFAEQNHWSIKAIAGDNPLRTIEQNIVDVMHRTAGRFNQLQELKDRHAVTLANDIEAIQSKRRREHLTRPRTELDRLPYQLFLEQYDRYQNYNVRAATQDNTEGRIVCHTSATNNGYFIPNGEDGNVGVCPCQFREAFDLGCRHEQAARITNNEEPFCRQTTDKRHLFLHVLPFANRDMTIAQTHVEKDNDVLNRNIDMSEGK